MMNPRLTLPVMLVSLWVTLAALGIRDELSMLQGIETWVTQAWRAWAHVIVHADLSHALTNAVAFFAMLMLWPQWLKSQRVMLLLWAVYGASAPFVVDSNAFGASGWLHAMFAYAALTWGFEGSLRKTSSVLMLAGLAFKLLAESQAWVDVQGVAWHLHIAGVATGLLLASIGLVVSHTKSKSA